MKKIAVSHHFLAHYRYPIFQALSESKDIEFTLISGESTDIPIETIDTSLAKKNINEGGLRWKIIKNIWFIKKKILWQSGLVSTILFSNFDAYIFLGSPYHLSTWVATILARLKGKKVFFWMHGVYSSDLTFSDFFNLKVFYRLPNGFFLYGNRAKDILIQHKVTKQEKIHIIYNSLNYAASKKARVVLSEGDYQKFRFETFSDKHTPIIIFIGRLNNVKKIDLLINVQNKIKQKIGYSLFNLIIIGDGEEKNNLQKDAFNMKLDKNVVFKGAMYDESLIGKLIQHSDLCVTPGEIGLTAIHSMSYGTPVISHNNSNIQMPEVEAIKINFTGDLYEYQNIDDLQNKIENWLKRYPTKSTKIIENCYNVIDTYYNPKNQLKTFINALESI